jgi:serine protease Do
MFHDYSDLNDGRSNGDVVRRYNRVIIMLVAMCCLSLGIAVGAVLRGIAGARAEDDRLIINHSEMAPDSLSAAFTRVARQVEPSVVNIKVTQGGGHGIAGPEGTASGMIIDPAGFILTNRHVISNVSRIKVQLPGGGEYDARLIGQDDDTDLAVLKINAGKALPAVRMGDSEKLNVGDWVLAIGSPFGWDQTVTAGIISAKGRVVERPFQQFLQTDAVINPGNSGGPLVNLAGQVVGINTEIETTTGYYNGIGFALPSSTAVDICNQLIAQGHVTRGFLGVRLEDVSPELARKIGIPENQGAVVLDVTSKDSPAAISGIRRGDVIIAVNGQRVQNKTDLVRQVAALPVGSSAVITYIRDGHERTASVRLNERRDEKSSDQVTPPERRPSDPPSSDSQDLSQVIPQSGRNHNADAGQSRPTAKPPLGLSVQTLKPDGARQIGLTGAQGVLIIRTESGSIAGEAGLRAEDVITEINGRTIRTVDDYLRVVQQLKSGDDVNIRVLRGDGTGVVGKITSAIATFTIP